MDRIDIVVEVPPVDGSLLGEQPDAAESSAVMRARVEAARRFALRRNGDAPSSRNGNENPVGHPLALASSYKVGSGARRLLQEALDRDTLGGRGLVRSLGVARTLADLDASDRVTERHVAEALSLRPGHAGRTGF